MPRKKNDEAPSKPIAKGMDGVLSVTLHTASGEETRSYRVPGLLGNTLAAQRTGKGLDDILIPALQRVFGGQVTAE
jgi:hypothetical protein